MPYVLETGFPLPAAALVPKRKTNTKYPFAQMEPGDCFLVPIEDAKKARHAVKKWADRHPGWRYYTRQETDGVRIWRNLDAKK
jgi:hypothetical protein